MRSKTLASVMNVVPSLPQSCSVLPRLFRRLRSSRLLPALVRRALSAPPHALVVEVEQPSVRVVGLLQLLVGGSVVVAPELFSRVKRRRIQRFMPVQSGDLTFDEAIMILGDLPWRQRHRPPEPDIYVNIPSTQRVQRP